MRMSYVDMDARLGLYLMVGPKTKEKWCERWQHTGLTESTSQHIIPSRTDLLNVATMPSSTVWQSILRVGPVSGFGIFRWRCGQTGLLFVVPLVIQPSDCYMGV